MDFSRSLSCCFVPIACLLSLTAAGTNAARPNIVMVFVDDLGYGDLSSYGAQDLKSPHIDKLVSRGMRFDNFYANCPVCSERTKISVT